MFLGLLLSAFVAYLVQNSLGLTQTVMSLWLPVIIVEMVIGVGPILVIALAAERGPFSPFALSLWPMLGSFYNILVAFVFCYWAWTKIAIQAPVGVSSLAVMMVPVVGVFSGVLVLGETPHWQDYAALVLVVGSLATVLVPPRTSNRLGRQ